MRRITFIYVCVSLIVITAMFSSCAREKQEAANIEKIHREEGAPIRVMEITPREFQSELTFHAILSGLKESTAHASIGGKIENVLVKAGDRVQKDQILMTFPADSPAAKYYQARAAYENAKTTFDRIDGLYKSGGISLQERDNTAARLEVARADWHAVQQTVKVLAPISGYVTRLYVSPTDNVDKETPLAAIADTSSLKAAINVSEDEIFHIKVGMPATAVWKDFRIEGKVTQVDSAMNLYTRSFRTVVEFSNPENKLPAGASADIHITTYSSSQALTVPVQNILKEENRRYVFLEKNGKAVRREISTGAQNGLEIEVTQGLEPGDLVVVEGHSMLHDGDKTRIIKEQQN